MRADDRIIVAGYKGQLSPILAHRQKSRLAAAADTPTQLQLDSDSSNAPSASDARRLKPRTEERDHRVMRMVHHRDIQRCCYCGTKVQEFTKASMHIVAHSERDRHAALPKALWKIRDVPDVPDNLFLGCRNCNGDYDYGFLNSVSVHDIPDAEERARVIKETIAFAVADTKRFRDSQLAAAQVSFAFADQRLKVVCFLCLFAGSRRGGLGDS